MYVCACVCMCVCTCERLCVCMCVCVYMFGKLRKESEEGLVCCIVIWNDMTV